MATPALRIRIAPKFPAKIQGSGGITIDRTGGVITIGGAGIRPAASEIEATEGIDNFKTMTPLRTKQAIAVAAPNILIGTRNLAQKLNDDMRTVLDFSPDTVDVDGGDAARFTSAFNDAISFMASRGGGSITIPPAPNGQPYLLDPEVYDLTGATSNVRVYGPGVVIEPSGGTTDSLLVLKDGWFEMDGITFNDPNGYLTAGAVIETSAEQALPQRFRNLKATNVNLMWSNKGAYNAGFSNFHGINVNTFHHNYFGGVGNFIEHLWVQGGKYGIILDGMQSPTDHSEGFMLRNANILCTQDNSIGIHIIDALLVQINTVVVGQMGTGGSCIVIAPQEVADGVTMVQAHQVYLDAGEGGWGIDMLAGLGNIRNNTFNDVVMSFKGGVPNTNGLRMHDCSDIVLDRVRTFQGLTGKDAEFVNSVNIECRNTDFSNGTGVTEDSSCRITWDVEDHQGTPATRSPLSMYPRADLKAFTSTIGSTVGAITTLTQACRAKRIDQHRALVEINFTLTDPGTASGYLTFTVPWATKGETIRFGAETAITGVGMQVFTGGTPTTTFVIRSAAGSAASFASGASYSFEFEYTLA